MRHWLYRSGWRLLPGLLATGLALLGTRTESFQSFEHGVYRALFHIRGEQTWDQRIAVIEIDEASLAKIGKFPWPRRYYADLLDQIAPAQPSVVAFDILFAETSEEDADLATAMADYGNVVLATAWDKQSGVIGPNAHVMEAAIATGHIHHQADADGITRTYQATINDTPALSIAAVKHFSRTVPNTAAALETSSQNLWLNWYGAAQGAPRYSFYEVLAGQVSNDAFTEKIIFVGFTGAELDTMTTPYNWNHSATGVYQHVVAANNLLADSHLKPVVMPVFLLFMLLNILLGYWLCYRCWPVQLLLGLFILCIWCSIVVIAFHYNYLLPTAMPVVSIATTCCIVGGAKQLQSKLRYLQIWPDTGMIPSAVLLPFCSSVKSSLSRR